MSDGRARIVNRSAAVWAVAFALLALYVAVRMGGFALRAEVATPRGAISLPNTFASVDHPFHVARADTLWRELASGHLLRWVGQHQGGYPVEFYPLGEAWLEVAIRALSLGRLAAAGAHTWAVIALFLLPGAAFAALAREDRQPLALALLALVLHVSLPGGWYHGGYTELVQWGLVTNVAGAVVSLLMFPAALRFLASGSRRAAALAVVLAAAAIYSNPRSILGLGALVAGAWLAVITGSHPVSPGTASWRASAVGVVAGLLAAPELIALARFSHLYTFVHYSGYDSPRDYLANGIAAVSWPVTLLALGGVALGLRARARLATRAVACALILYVALTTLVAFVPALAAMAPQLEPTRLMPLQRLLTLYLAAATLLAALASLAGRRAPGRAWLPQLVAAALAALVLAILTRPLPGPIPDPASPAMPPVSLYPVITSATPEQADLELAVRAADEAAVPGTALLVLGSALSWHQQLWSPLWTARPLYYDNWLWYWHPDQRGTPGYRASAGHHFPDPERTLEREYLSRHGIGAVVVTGRAREAAAASPELRALREGVYDAYVVVDPVTTITFGGENATLSRQGNQRLAGESPAPGAPVQIRSNWHPRWSGTSGGRSVELDRADDGYLRVSSEQAVRQITLTYQVEPLDWIARFLAIAGVACLVFLGVSSRSSHRARARWYAPPPGGARHE